LLGIKWGGLNFIMPYEVLSMEIFEDSGFKGESSRSILETL
jgi:hypothetical protein